MLQERWERSAAVAGLVFFPLVVASIALTSGTPGESDSVQKFASYFADNGHQTQAYLSTVAGALGGILFLWFLVGLRSVLLRAEGGPGHMTALAFAGGIVLLALQEAGGAAYVVYPAVVDSFDKFGSDGHLAMITLALSFWLAQLSGVGGTLLLSGVAAVAFRTKFLPAWLTWFTVLAALGQLLSIAFFVPGFLAILWVLVVAGYMLASRRTVEAAPPATAPAMGAT